MNAKEAQSEALPDGMTPDVYTSLVHSLFGSFVSLAAGALGGSLASAVTVWPSQDPWLAASCLLICTVGLMRVAIAFMYGRRPAQDWSVAETQTWERLYAFGACAYSAALGLWCFIGITLGAGEVVHVICVSVTIGYTAGISGRNAGRPRIVVAQILLAATPLSAALLLRGDPYYASLALFMAMFFLSMHGVSRSLYDTLVKALTATRDVTALAKRFDTALNNMSHGLAMFDADGIVVVCNERLLRLFALPQDVLARRPNLSDLLTAWQAAGAITAVDRERAIRELGAWFRGEAHGAIEVVTLTGRVILFAVEPMANGGSVMMVEDITERRQAEAQIAHLARFDHLTDLPNRTFFRDYVEQALSRTGRTREPFAILCVDLDRFKEVNDTLGHPVGDRLLAAVSLRLRGLVRGSDIVARFGGDEFVVLQTPIETPENAGALAARIVDVLGEPYDVDGHRVVTGASVGVAFAPADGTGFDTLLKNADMALYSAKSDGRGTFRFFETEMDLRAQARRSLELDLRSAVANRAFDVHYQPLMNIQSGRMSACEALVRWQHPDKGFISPATFIPVAEEMGLIVEIGEWVLRRACTEARRWPGNTRVAVNLSSVQFLRGDLVSVVERALKDADLPATRLELEVTETILLQDNDRTRDTLRQLHALGIRLSLDDFGTGYSSLSYLQSYRFDKVKIDRSFLREIGTREHSLTMVRGVAQLSRDLGMSVTVEGVETLEQLAIISKEMAVDEAQGYLISRPLPARDLRRFLAANTVKLGRIA